MTAAGPRTAVGVGGAYAVAYVVVTGMLPAPESTLVRELLADLYLVIPTVAALAWTTRAAARSLGPERAFWSLLAAACGGQLVNEAAYAARLFQPHAALAALGHAGYCTFNVLAGVALVVWPHRPLPASRAAAAALDCLMVAVAAYFLVFYFISAPLAGTDPASFWVLSGQQLLLAAGAGVLAFTVREPPYGLVYRCLAGGFGAALLLGLVPNWQYAHGHLALYSPLNLDWIAMLVGIAAAATVPRGPAWVQAGEGSEAAARRARLAAAAVLLPALVDLVARLAALQPHLAAERTSLALAATAALVALGALRLGRAPRGSEEAFGVRGPGSERVHFASGVAHEVNNPLMAVAGWAELAVGRGQPQRPLETLLASARRAAAIVSRLQQLGDAAAPITAATAPTRADSGSLRLPAGREASRRRAGRTLVAAGVFAAVYFGTHALGAPPVTGDLLLFLPAAAAVTILSRRASASRVQRRLWFWRLLVAGVSLWVVGNVLWVGYELAGRRPYATPFTVLDTLYLAFLVPMIAALALKPHGRERALDLTAAVDVGLALTAVALLFLRVTILPVVDLVGILLGRRIVLAALAAALAGASILLWRLAESPGWRRVYAYLAAFGLSYGVLSAVANGLRGPMVAPGGLADVAWIVPFVLLCVGASRAFPASPGDTPRALLALPAFVLVLDLFLTYTWPDLFAAGHPATTVLAAAMALLAALRLRLEVGAEARARRAARMAADEEARAQRLAALASVAAAAVADLAEALEDLCRQARAAAVVYPEKGDVMLQQARRARAIVRELAASFHLESPRDARADVDVTALVAQVVEGALVDGLPLQVSLDGLAGLPAVPGDPSALRAAIAHLVKNAAHASPGGVLHIRGTLEPRHLVLRFQDDGPGVPAAARAQIFDPFFTTRRVGNGLGLGLTQVHFAARDHGGTIVLEDGAGGACFALRLPLGERRAEAPREAWPYMAAALVAAAAAVALVVISPVVVRTRLSVVLQIGSALAASAGLGWAAARHEGARRRFWTLLAAGPLVWAATRVLRVLEGGFDGLPGAGVWHLVLFAVADLMWAGALLLRADRRRSDRPELGAAVGAALLLFGYAHANLVVLPDPYAGSDGVVLQQLVLVRSLQKLAIAVWALVLGVLAGTRFWRTLYRRLGVVLLFWVAGNTIAAWFRFQPDYRGGTLSDLGWIMPFLALAAFGAREALRPATAEPTVAVAASPRVPQAAAWLVALAGIVAFEAAFGFAAGDPALDAARTTLLRVMVIALALLFAAHEWLARRRPTDSRRVDRDSGPTRWARMVASAIHELGGHLSGIAAVNRLILTDPDLASRARSDAARVQERAEAAARVVHNLLAAVPASLGGRERLNVNEVVREALEARRPALAQDGVALAFRPGADVPECVLDSAALRHIVLGLLDRAAVSIRSTGRPGTIEVSTRAGEGRVHLKVCDDGRRPASGRFGRFMGVLLDAPPDVEADLERSLVRESVAREGGTLRAECRPGATEIAVSLPLVRPEPIAINAR
jgi:signal transduction histidine kinase